MELRIDEFKGAFLKAWKATPLMPLKARRSMALEQVLEKDEILRLAWQMARDTQPGMESGAANADLLRLGRQMAGYMGRLARTERERTTNGATKSTKGGGGRNGKKGATHQIQVHRTEGKADGVEGCFRRACEFGFVPADVWWIRVFGVDYSALERILSQMKREGWVFESHGSGAMVKMDARQAKIVEIERKMDELRGQLEGLKNG